MPLLDVGERLRTPFGRIDLAADLISVLVHPKDTLRKRLRRVALAETLLGMRDDNDEPDARAQVEGWFRKFGGYKTASEADPYSKQQNDFVRQVPKILTVGNTLDLVWRMDAHHRTALASGASLNKAFAILRDPITNFPFSERNLRSAWSQYKPVAPLCAVFALAFEEAMREGGPSELHERLTHAFDEQLHVTLALVASYQRFATEFTPHGQKQPMLDPSKIWFLRNIEPDTSFLPPPLPPVLLKVVEAYEAPRPNA